MNNISQLSRLLGLRTYADAFNARIAMMQAENKRREINGESLLYDEFDFNKQCEKLENIAREMEKIR